VIGTSATSGPWPASDANDDDHNRSILRVVSDCVKTHGPFDCSGVGSLPTRSGAASAQPTPIKHTERTLHGSFLTVVRAGPVLAVEVFIEELGLDRRE
jgi:hypothetical protein